MKNKTIILLILSIILTNTLPVTVFAENVSTEKNATKETSVVVSTEPVSTEPETTKPVVTKPKKTKVKGLKHLQNVSTKKTIKDKISISPAFSRKVYLQKYNEKSKKWKTVKTYKTKNKESAKLTIIYPKDKWKNKSKTYWRIYAKANKKATKYVSKSVKIIPKNRVKMKLKCKAAIIVDLDTGAIYYEKNKSEKRCPASMTKILTAICAIENTDMKEKVEYTKQAYKTPWSWLPYMYIGDKTKMYDILHAVLLPSSNGAATAVGMHVSGSTKKFVKLMNNTAKEIGCKDTHYSDPHGLADDDHYTTAYDISLMLRYAYKKPVFREIIGKTKYTFKTTNTKKYMTVYTTNKLLGVDKKVIGGKTGFTTKAGNCYAGVYKKSKKHKYITIVMGASDSDNLWSTVKELNYYINKNI